MIEPKKQLVDYLEALKRDDCYRVDTVLKESPSEITQKVYFVGANGAEQGPYIRKYIKNEGSIGAAYQKIFEVQQKGRRFYHLPAILDCYILDENLTVVMEYIQGETLLDVVYRLEPSLALTFDLFPKLCDAVLELHRGFNPPIIHRDLKPTNVMIGVENVWIIDFGISRLYREDAAWDTHHFGSVNFAPPEQFGFGQTDERSDVYSLGTLLYFCLKEGEIDARVRKKGFVDPQIPVDLQNILLKTTQLDPDARFQDVEELKAAFLAARSRYFSSGAPQQTKQIWTATDSASSFAANEKKRPSSGIARNITTLVLFMLFGLASISAALNPQEGSVYAQMPMAKSVVLHVLVWITMIGSPLFFLSNRKALRSLVPIYDRIPIKRDKWICLIIVAAGFILCGIILYLP